MQKNPQQKHVCLKFYEVTKYRQLLCFLELIINIHISTYGGYIEYILYTNMSLLLPLIVSLPWDLCSCPGIVAWYNKDGVECQNKNELTSTWPFPRQNLSVREKDVFRRDPETACVLGERELWPPACSQAAGAGLFAMCFQTIKSDVKFGSVINLGLWFIEFCFEREVRQQYFCFSRKH